MAERRFHHISSAVVTALPGRVAEIEHELAALPGTEIHASAGGRIIIVMEGASTGELGNRLTTIAAMPGVLSANMVFEHIDELEETAT